MAETTELRLDLVDDGTDTEELDQMTRRIQESLLDLDVEDVTPLSEGPAPDGTKAVDAALIGGLLVTLMQTPTLINSIIGVLSSWVGGRANRSVKVTIEGDTLELTGASDEERRDVVNAWLARHSGETDSS
jgi:hypothetical protein